MFSLASGFDIILFELFFAMSQNFLVEYIMKSVSNGKSSLLMYESFDTGQTSSRLHSKHQLDGPTN